MSTPAVGIYYHGQHCWYPIKHCSCLLTFRVPECHRVLYIHDFKKLDQHKRTHFLSKRLVYEEKNQKEYLCELFTLDTTNTPLLPDTLWCSTYWGWITKIEYWCRQHNMNRQKRKCFVLTISCSLYKKVRDHKSGMCVCGNKLNKKNINNCDTHLLNKWQVFPMFITWVSSQVKWFQVYRY